MGIFNAIAVMVSGLYGAHRVSTKITALADEWFKLWTSICATCIVTFLGIFGATGLGSIASGRSLGISTGIAVFTASLSTAAAFLAMWKRSSLTRGLPILAPMVVEQKVLEGGFVYTEPNKTGG